MIREKGNLLKVLNFPRIYLPNGGFILTFKNPVITAGKQNKTHVDIYCPRGNKIRLKCKITVKGNENKQIVEKGQSN